MRKLPAHYGRRGHRRIEDGYVLVYQPEHPRAKSNGYVREHILVASRALGRPVPAKHPIHHVDDDGTNNTPGNLVLCEDQGYHLLLHRRMRALLACGDPSALRCTYCGGYDRQDEMFKTTRKNRPSRFGAEPRGYHRECERAAWRRREGKAS